MAIEMTGAFRGALDDVARAALEHLPGTVDLSAFKKLGEDDTQAIVAHLDRVVFVATNSAMRVFVGDSRLYGRRMMGRGVYFVLVSAPTADNTLRPEYHDGAVLYYVTGTEYGLYDLGRPGTQQEVTRKSPAGIPSNWVLPWTMG